ncbi:MAG: hypothetical protein OQL16_02240 [Gammaproteobacteria bacterium]|nr:hypothetical protein [Gammaproteobacteria bacterium]
MSTIQSRSRHTLMLHQLRLIVLNENAMSLPDISDCNAGTGLGIYTIKRG